MSDFYQFQRAMRRLRQAALQRGVVAILDVGSSKIACMILQFDGPAQSDYGDGVGSLAGHSTFRIIGSRMTRSRGVKYGTIETMPETERAMRTVLQATQKMAGRRVDHVITCFAGAAPRSYGLVGEVALEDGLVTDNEIGRVLAACEIPQIGSDRDVLHAQPINFALDHRSSLSDPRDLQGNNLTTDVHMVTADADAVRNLLYCVHRCDVELAGVALAPYTSGLSALGEDEKELGAACIDMGGGTTSVSIFWKKHMIYADSVRMGGDHVTADISQGLQIPMAQAERIKTVNGGVIATGQDDRERIDLGGETGDWEHDRRSVRRAELIGIMRPRVEEILEEARARLDTAGFDQLDGQQIVLTGGASQIPGLDGLAARILGQQVRLGRPLRIQGLPQANTGPEFSSIVGLALFAANPQDEWWDFELPVERYPARSLKRAVKWFRDNW